MAQLTWGEFKKQVEAQGVKDEDKLAWIDSDAFEPVIVERFPDGEVRIMS